LSDVLEKASDKGKEVWERYLALQRIQFLAKHNIEFRRNLMLRQCPETINFGTLVVEEYA
jgi:hypothetical protein